MSGEIPRNFFANISLYPLPHRQACLPMSAFIRPGTDDKGVEHKYSLHKMI